ncbi:hypothetical protein AVEN_223791-1 [Araneus ventricosus]|uniref:Uncharacterized protein n=1 Tax=Araneus ventricosus TaxID=182803 RepID=A0A4Y2DK97_ARAVE|nr:hypothetical protein AVEN_223791-1 [Araneus ventricosus]
MVLFFAMQRHENVVTGGVELAMELFFTIRRHEKCRRCRGNGAGFHDPKACKMSYREVGVGNGVAFHDPKDINPLANIYLFIKTLSATANQLTPRGSGCRCLA